MSDHSQSRNAKLDESRQFSAVQEFSSNLVTRDEGLLERYLLELEANGEASPERFLDQLRTDFSESARNELLQSLRSLQLVFAAGKQLTSHSRTALPGSGSSLGDFQIVRPLGRGGMGVVFLAKQISLDRTVALKILFAGGIPDPSMRARFQLEARAAATLHHPNIVPVFAIGQEQEVDFYAMQFIDGRSLHDELKGISFEPNFSQLSSPTRTTAENRNRSTVADQADRSLERSRAKAIEPRRALRIAERVADALTHAHRGGIIHRDVKPSNILLDEQDQPWLADFGLAQITSGPDITAPGTILGTLRYMSPEQLKSGPSGQTVVDPRTDIYSLGATLYEMLAGRPAFAGGNREELTQWISEGRFAALRSICPEVPRDVATVVHKAMESDAANRYASAGDFAADLRACLEQRPIRATPPTIADRIGKWSRRNRPLVRIALLAGCVALVAMTIAWWRVSMANVENRKLVAELTTAKAASDTNLSYARRALDDFFLNTNIELREIPGSFPLRQRLLASSEEYYAALMRANTESQLPIADLARLHYQMAVSCLDRQLLDESGKHAQDSLRELNELSFPQDTTLHLKYRNHLVLASVAAGRQQLEDSLRELEQASDLHSQAGASNYRPDFWFRDGLHIAAERCMLLDDFGRVPEANELYRTSIATARSWLESHPDDHWAQIRLAEMQIDWANLATKSRNFEEAKRLLDAASPMATRLAGNPSVLYSGKKLEVRSEFQYGELLARTGKFGEAKARYEHASSLAAELAERYQDQAEAKFLELQSKIAFIQVLAQTSNGEKKKDAEIDDIERQVKQWIQEDLPPGIDPSDLAGAVHDVGLYVLEQGELDRAAELFALARDQSTRSLEKNPQAIKTAIYLSNHHYALARVRFEQRALNASVDEFSHAAKWRKQYLERLPNDNREKMVLGEMYSVWPKLLGKLGRWQDAANICRSGIVIADELIDSDWEVGVNKSRRSVLLQGLTETACYAKNARLLEEAIERRIDLAKQGSDPSKQLGELLDNLKSFIPDPLDQSPANAECLKTVQRYFPQLENTRKAEEID